MKTTTVALWASTVMKTWQTGVMSRIECLYDPSQTKSSHPCHDKSNVPAIHPIHIYPDIPFSLDPDKDLAYTSNLLMEIF